MEEDSLFVDMIKKKNILNGIIEKDFSIVSILILAGFIAYFPGLEAPWYADDYFHIVNNDKIGDFQYYLGRLFSARGLTTLSFAVNYQWFGTDVLGYHICNLGIHLASSVVVFYLLLRVFKNERWLALSGSLVFLLHPLQTQAVTYIVQRASSLSALFVLLGMLFWCRLRDAEEKEYYYFAPVLLCGILALLSKANAIVFPFLLILFDMFLLDKRKGETGKYWQFFFLLLISLGMIGLKFFLGAGFAQMVPFLSSQMAQGDAADLMSRLPKVLFFERTMSGSDALIGTFNPPNLQLRYLATELVIFWEYLRLMVFPADQLLDYSYPLVNKVFNWKTVLSIFAIFFCFFLAWKRQARMWMFFILWVLVSLSVESSIIPLDPLVEHRLYLPMFGFVVVFLSIVRVGKSDGYKSFLVVGLILVLFALTVNRNNLWANPVSFWQDHVQKVPGSYRVWHHLGSELVKVKRYNDAIPCFHRALTLNSPVEVEIFANLGLAYLKIGNFSQAQLFLRKSLDINDQDAGVHSNLGTVLFDLGDVKQAMKHLIAAVKLEPSADSFMLNLAAAHVYLRQYNEAAMIYSRVLALYPRHSQALRGMTIVEQKKASQEGSR